MSSRTSDKSGLKMLDPNDPGAWDNSYPVAEQAIRTSPEWNSAFATIVDAYLAHELEPMNDCYRRQAHIVDQRRMLSDLVKEVFDRLTDQWPDYAHAVWQAATAPGNMSSEDTTGAGEGGGTAGSVEVPRDTLSKGGTDPAGIPDKGDVNAIAASVTTLFLAGLFEGALSLELLSDQWWDPKYPRSGAAWTEGFTTLKTLIVSANEWKRAFQVVRAASEAAELREMVILYTSTVNTWDKRLGLWHWVSKNVFVDDPDKWPGYARVVSDTVTSDMVKRRGRLRGIPRSWKEKPLWIVSFKVLVLLISGLLEKKVPASLADP